MKTLGYFCAELNTFPHQVNENAFLVVSLMMEKTSALLNKGNAELLRGLEDGDIVLAAAGSSNVLDTRAGGAEDVVDKRELEAKG